MIINQDIARPPIRFHGGKWALAPWILSFFPQHANYVEPMAGSFSVLLRKPRSRLETVNDLDCHVVNFFKVLREKPAELLRLIRLTPWSRTEFEFCRNPHGDPLEKARQFYLSSMMTFARTAHDETSGPRFLTDVRPARSTISVVITEASTEHLFAIAKRLNGVQIENRDWKEMLTAYDNDGALFYVDPPYLPETRTAHGQVYAHDWNTQDHIDAAALLHDCEGFVILSGYRSELYEELYERQGWIRKQKGAAIDRGERRIECLWLSPKTVTALNLLTQERMKL